MDADGVSCGELLRREFGDANVVCSRAVLPGGMGGAAELHGGDVLPAEYCDGCVGGDECDVSRGELLSREIGDAGVALDIGKPTASSVLRW